jgi:hypothetical protein
MTRRTDAGESEVERYLDDMFDRLAHTGGAGRRALAETEDHLRAAVADGMTRGLPAGQAEHEAVARFGPAGRIARQMRSAGRGGRIGRPVSNALLLAGIALAGLGVSYLAAASGSVLWHPDCSSFLTQDCYLTQTTHQVAGTGTMFLVLGVALLLSRLLAARATGLAVSARNTALCAAAWCALAGAVSYADTAAPYSGGRLDLWWLAGLKAPLLAGGVTIAAALAAAAWSLARSHRPRYLR